MSVRAGDRLPAALFERLSGGGLAARPREAILIATTDESGRPHPALLAYGEMVALSPSRLRLAVGAGSTTARNLRERGAVTVCLIAADGVAYVKARARPVEADPSLAAKELAVFEAEVEEVLVDAPAPGEDARLLTGITFATGDPARLARDSATRIEALRRG